MSGSAQRGRDGRKIGTVFEVKKEILLLSPYKYLRREDALFMEYFSGGRMAIEIGVNMEFIRSEDKPFEEGVQRAAKLGYEWVEPMVHNGRELLSEAGYFHSFSMDNDPLEMKDILDRHGVRPSGLSSHCPLMRPEISVPYLEKAIRFAAAIGAPVLATDEGIRPTWLDDKECFEVMKYTLKKVLQVAERHGIYIGIEPHQSISRTTEGLLRIANLVESPMLKVNYDTGNSFLAGTDPYAGLRSVLPQLVHVHAKDIAMTQAEAEKGKVTGTRVGCAWGDGVIDWERVVSILRDGNYKGVLSVECGTSDQAMRSLVHLRSVLQEGLQQANSERTFTEAPHKSRNQTC